MFMYYNAQGKAVYYDDLTQEQKDKYNADVEEMLRLRHFRRVGTFSDCADLLRRLAELVRQMAPHHAAIMDEGVFAAAADCPLQNTVPAAFHTIADQYDGVIVCMNKSHARDIARFGNNGSEKIMSDATEELRRAADLLPRQSGFLQFAPPAAGKKTRQKKRAAKPAESVEEYAWTIRRLADFPPMINRNYMNLLDIDTFNKSELGTVVEYPKLLAPVVFLNIAAAFRQIGEANKQIAAAARRLRPNTEDDDWGPAESLEHVNNLFLKETEYMLDLNPVRRQTDEKAEAQAAAKAKREAEEAEEQEIKRARAQKRAQKKRAPKPAKKKPAKKSAPKKAGRKTAAKPKKKRAKR